MLEPERGAGRGGIAERIKVSLEMAMGAVSIDEPEYLRLFRTVEDLNPGGGRTPADPGGGDGGPPIGPELEALKERAPSWID